LDFENNPKKNKQINIFGGEGGKKSGKGERRSDTDKFIV